MELLCSVADPSNVALFVLLAMLLSAGQGTLSTSTLQLRVPHIPLSLTLMHLQKGSSDVSDHLVPMMKMLEMITSQQVHISFIFVRNVRGQYES